MKANNLRRLKILKKLHPNALTILAEGDSWFQYPREYLVGGRDANIIDHLYEKDDLIILNVSSNGDEAVGMLSGKDKFNLIDTLEDYGKFDILLFSGGGNDLVGNYDFPFILNERKDGMDWMDCINQERLKIKIDQVKSSYEFLCELSKDFHNLKVFSHTYDLAPPRKKGTRPIKGLPFELCDGWIKIYMEEKNILNDSDQKNILHYVLKAFRRELMEIDLKYDNFTVIDTHGTLNDNQWRDEIHPTSEGFELISEKIYDVIKK